MLYAIRTELVYPPIPVRNWDWEAVLDGYEPGDPIGCGATEDAAIADLLDALEQTHDAPRIKQYLDAETADRLLVHCGGRSRPALAVVILDYEGRNWSLERSPDTILKEGDPGGVIWRRLRVPPLPNGGDDA